MRPEHHEHHDQHRQLGENHQRQHDHSAQRELEADRHGALKQQITSDHAKAADKQQLRPALDKQPRGCCKRPVYVVNRRGHRVRWLSCSGPGRSPDGPSLFLQLRSNSNHLGLNLIAGTQVYLIRLAGLDPRGLSQIREQRFGGYQLSRVRPAASLAGPL